MSALSIKIWSMTASDHHSMTESANCTKSTISKVTFACCCCGGCIVWVVDGSESRTRRNSVQCILKDQGVGCFLSFKSNIESLIFCGRKNRCFSVALVSWTRSTFASSSRLAIIVFIQSLFSHSNAQTTEHCLTMTFTFHFIGTVS